jgi:predicted RNase H-like HicB family nuclease
MNIHAEFGREEDGRWFAEIPQVPGARVYGPTRREAAMAVAIRAFHILAERVHSGELKVEDESEAIILGGTANSLSELLVELQHGCTPAAEPIAAIVERKGDVESFPGVKEPSVASSVAEASENFAPPPLPTPRTLADYHRLRDLLEDLIEKVGADESHPLAAYMDRVGTLVEQYETTHLSEIIESKQKR